MRCIASELTIHADRVVHFGLQNLRLLLLPPPREAVDQQACGDEQADGGDACSRCGAVVLLHEKRAPRDHIQHAQDDHRPTQTFVDELPSGPVPALRLSSLWLVGAEEPVQRLQRPDDDDDETDPSVDPVKMCGKGAARPAGGARRRAGGAGSGPAAGRGAGGGSSNILQFYKDDSPGLQVGPTTVLVASLSFVGIVVLLHIWGKFRMSYGGE